MLADNLHAAAIAAQKPALAQWAAEVAAAALAEAPRAGLEPSELGLDVLGIIDRETRGKNILGDGGHGHGLMQIDDRFWNLWLKANANGLEPASNIRKGTAIYVDYLLQVRRYAAGLVVPAADATVRRVAMASYNAGAHRCGQILAETGDPDQVDQVTTGKDYGKDTWARRQALALHMPPEACPAP